MEENTFKKELLKELLVQLILASHESGGLDNWKRIRESFSDLTDSDIEDFLKSLQKKKL